MLLLGVALACAAASGAGSGSGEAIDSDASPQENNRPPVIESLRFDPAIPLRGERLTVRVEASDPDGDPIEFAYLWRLDGARMTELETGGASVRLHSADRNALVEVSVIASDGQTESKTARLAARVGNRPPQVIDLELFPAPTATVEDSVSAHARSWGSDRDLLSYTDQW